MRIKQCVKCDGILETHHRLPADSPSRQCGRQHKSRECPVYGQKCAICQKYNHFAKVCRSKLKHKLQTSAKRKVDAVNKDPESSSLDSDEDEDVFSLDPLQIDNLVNRS